MELSVPAEEYMQRQFFTNVIPQVEMPEEAFHIKSF
jgi:hypothetical protein